jgi:hypothetical protein
VLGITAVLQLAVFALSGSVALLSDLIHNAVAGMRRSVGIRTPRIARMHQSGAKVPESDRCVGERPSAIRE